MYQVSLTIKDAQLTTLRGQSETKDSRIATLDNDLQDKNQKIASLKAQLAEVKQSSQGYTGEETSNLQAKLITTENRLAEVERLRSECISKLTAAKNTIEGLEEASVCAPDKQVELSGNEVWISKDQAISFFVQEAFCASTPPVSYFNIRGKGVEAVELGDRMDFPGFYIIVTGITCDLLTNTRASTPPFHLVDKVTFQVHPIGVSQ